MCAIMPLMSSQESSHLERKLRSVGRGILPPESACIPFSVFFVSWGVLALELALVRLFSIAHWHHFAYLIISIALLGFGASGSALHVLGARTRRRPGAWLAAAALAFALACPLSWLAAQAVPLNVLEIGWDARQAVYLAAWGMIFFLPFFFGAAFVGLALKMKECVPERIYGANLLGSGAGAVGALVLMYDRPPQRLLGYCACAGIVAAGLVFPGRSRVRGLVRAAAVLLGIAAVCVSDRLPVGISQFKDLSALLRLPGARVLGRRFSPMGRLDIVESDLIRHAPGLSVSYKGRPVPPQTALTIDGDSMTAITDFGDDRRNLEFLDHTTAALPYYLAKADDVLVLGAGAGLDVLPALYHNAARVTAVEINPQMAELVRGDYRQRACGIYGRQNVRVVISEARRFVERCGERYDIITVPLLDTFAAASAGVYAGSESYLYTVEAMSAYIDHLKPDGVLCITRWARMPPRDSLKLLAAAAAALRGRGVEDPGAHLILVRSWRTVSLLVRPKVWGGSEIEGMKDFCETRGIDTAFYHGMSAGEANRFHVLSEPYYRQGASKILGPRREEFFRDSRFDLRPATDDRPYFFRFIRARDLPWLFRLDPLKRAALIEWGYVILIPALLLLVLGAVVLVVVPLLVVERRTAGLFSVTSAYFSLLGFGYMLIEVSIMQRLGLMLAHPVYSAAVVIGTFLVGSGIGSLVAEGWDIPAVSRARRALCGIIVLGVGVGVIVRSGLPSVWAWSLPARCAAAGALCLPLAFVMGIPFPEGLRILRGTFPEMVPAAWAVNGAASVIAATLAALLAMSAGFPAVAGLGIACYAAALGVTSALNATERHISV